MKITRIRLGKLSVPLRVPFKTALRTVSRVEDVVVELHTDTGAVGYGEAPPTGPITGDTTGGIVGGIVELIGPALVGQEVGRLRDRHTALVQKAGVHNTSAKAAVDMALWDLYGQLHPDPRSTSCWAGPGAALSPTSPSASTRPARWPWTPWRAVARGLRLPEGEGGGGPPPWTPPAWPPSARRWGRMVCIRIDANQAWTPRQAVRILNEMQDKGLDLELVEQPVPGRRPGGPGLCHSQQLGAGDGRRERFQPPPTPWRIFQSRGGRLRQHQADEVRRPDQRPPHRLGRRGLRGRVHDRLYAGGQDRAVNAAVELACARSIITRVDLDGPVLCSVDPVEGGAHFDERNITVSDEPGMGIHGVQEGYLTYLDM